MSGDNDNTTAVIEKSTVEAAPEASPTTEKAESVGIVAPISPLTTTDAPSIEETVPDPPEVPPEPTVSDLLPGFNEYAASQASSIAGHKAVDALQVLYLQDVIQRRARLLSHYLSLRQSAESSTALKFHWNVVSAELQGYSEAVKRWETFDRSVHSRITRAQEYPASDTANALNQLVARWFTASVYEQKFPTASPDPVAAREALRNETVNTDTQISTMCWNTGMLQTPAERKARLEATMLESDQKKEEAKRNQEKFRAFMARFWMALFGGVFLVVPMLIMSLHPTKTTSLTTTAVFTIFIAVLLAWFMKTADPKDIIAATAAYSAVLVVFVGTVTQPLTNSGNGSSNNHNGNGKGGGSHLSPGAIAGIVVGILAGLFLLVLLLLFCCCQGLIAGLFALFGLKRRRQKTSDPTIASDYASSYYTASNSSIQRPGRIITRPNATSFTRPRRVDSGDGRRR